MSPLLYTQLVNSNDKLNFALGKEKTNFYTKNVAHQQLHVSQKIVGGAKLHFNKLVICK